jgi:GTP-binding protein
VSQPEKAALPEIVSAEFVAGAKESKQLPPPTLVEVAFAGRSNVGKSSLLNCLLKRRNLVRTSSTPGCTRQINLLEVKSTDSSQFLLVDLPGYGYAKRSKTERKAWDVLIDDYLQTRPTLKAVVLLIDARRGVEEEEQQLIEYLAAPAKVSRRPVEVLLVATKLDKVSSSKRKLTVNALREQAKRPVVGFSSKDHTGRDELWRRVRLAAGLA